MRYQLYLANKVTGQKLSAYSFIEAEDLRQAKARFRTLYAHKNIDWNACDILGVV